MNAEYLIREYFKAYHARDRKALESLLSDDFAFCSPLDDNISRDQYLKTCWPNSEHQRNHLIEKLFVEENEAFATYECERTDGTKHEVSKHRVLLDRRRWHEPAGETLHN